MSDPQTESSDIWKQWLLHRRDVTDERKAAAEEAFRPIRDKVLDNGGVEPGETVLDVGTGTGLIAFGALERVGSEGHVIFSDISRDCLEHCRMIVDELGFANNASFVEAGVEDLSAIESESVNVVTSRSVVMYSDRKQKAFEEFYRVLKPGCAVSMFEPINRFGSSWKSTGEGYLRGFDLTPVADLLERVYQVVEGRTGGGVEQMVDFDERDLIEYARNAGFPIVRLDYEAMIQPMANTPWDYFYRTAPNPLAPSVEDAAREALSDQDLELFEECLRSALETQAPPAYRAFAWLVAVKGE